MKNRKLNKLLKNPASFFLDSKYFFFRKAGQALFNIEKKLNAPNKSNVVVNVVGKNIVSNKISDNKLKGTLYISSLIDFRIFEVIKKIATAAELNIEVGEFDLNVDGNIEAVLLIEDEITKLHFSIDSFFYLEDGLYLRKGLNKFIFEDFPSDSDILRKKIDLLNVAFWKQAGDNKALFGFYKNKSDAKLIDVVTYGVKGGVYNKELTGMAVKLLVENKSLTDDKINLIFSKIYRIKGPCSETEAAINAILKEKKRLSSSTLIKLAAFLCEAGDYSRCVDVVKLAKSSLESYRYIGLSNFLYKEKIVDAVWAEQDAFYFDMLKKNSTLLQDRLFSSNLNFNVVGNSPCELGLGKGASIDSSDLVIRFNSANVDYPYCLDYGKKTNILVINPRYYETKRNSKSNLDLMIVSDGSLYSTRNLAYRLHDLVDEAPLCLIPDKVDRELVSILEASPSSGLKMLYWIYLNIGPISPESIKGFSLVDQEDGVSTNYQTEEKRVLPIIHDWKKERELLNSILKK